MQSFKRKVIYLGGFDPRGARFYHDLLAEQIAPDGPFTLTERGRRGKNAIWTLRARDGSVESEQEFLVWDDLVRAHWLTRPWDLLRHAVVAYWRLLRHLDKPLERKVPDGSRFTLYYPGATFLGLPLILALVSFLAMRGLVGWGAIPFAAGAGLGLAWWLLRKIHSLWLLRFVIFNDQLARREVSPKVWERIEAFAQRIAAVLDEQWDEVVFVSHSNGTVLAVPIMARLLELRGGVLPAHFAMVTLGGCVQLLAARRDAAWFGQALDALGQGGWLWLDMGSPTDGACVPLVEPCLGRAVARPEGLVQLSPRWFRYCDSANYAARRRNKYQTHFDYLRRLDRPSALDYLGITGSARGLAASIAAFEAENHG
jgi:hypothetical protein